MIFWCYFIAAAVVLLDQLTKWLVVKYLMPAGSIPLIDGVLHLTYVENTGAAFGMMKDKRWIFMVVSTVAIIIIIVIIAKYARKNVFETVTVSMMLGGGIGNMIDRIRLGYVIDFIDVRLINFAVFNVADSFVTVGALLLIVCLVRELVLEKKEKGAAACAAGAKESSDEKKEITETAETAEAEAGDHAAEDENERSSEHNN